MLLTLHKTTNKILRKFWEKSAMEGAREPSTPSVPSTGNALLKGTESHTEISEDGDKLVEPQNGNRSWLPASYLEAVSEYDESPDKRRSSNKSRDKSPEGTPRKDPTWRPDEEEEESSEESSSEDSDSYCKVKRVRKGRREDTSCPPPVNGPISTANVNTGEVHVSTHTGASDDAGKYRRAAPCGGRSQNLTTKTAQNPEDPSVSFVVSDHKPIGTALGGNPDPKPGLEPSRNKGHTQALIDDALDEGVFRRPAPYGLSPSKNPPKKPHNDPKNVLSASVSKPNGTAPATNISAGALQLKAVENALITARLKYRELLGKYLLLSGRAKSFKCYDNSLKKFCRIEGACTTPVFCKTRKVMKRKARALRATYEMLKKKKQVVSAGRPMGEDAARHMPNAPAPAPSPAKSSQFVVDDCGSQSQRAANLAEAKTILTRLLGGCSATPLISASAVKCPLTPYSEVPAKRGRGRPRKSAPSILGISNSGGEPSSYPAVSAKQGRGRPRKIAPSVLSVSPDVFYSQKYALLGGQKGGSDSTLARPIAGPSCVSPLIAKVEEKMEYDPRAWMAGNSRASLPSAQSSLLISPKYLAKTTRELAQKKIGETASPVSGGHGVEVDIIAVKEDVISANDDVVTVKDDVTVEDDVISLKDEEGDLEDDIITDEIRREEKRLARQNELEAVNTAKREPELIQKSKWKLEREKSDEAIREQSRKRLMNLIEKSKFYADFMKKTLEHTQKKKGGRKADPTVSLNSAQTEIDSKKRKRKLLATCSEDMLETIQKKKKGENEALEEMSAVDSDESLVGATGQDFVTRSPGKPGIRRTSLGIEVREEQPLLLEGAVLRQYQIEGVNWLRDLFGNGMNGILADEMGLGKTIQTIAVICHLYANGVHGPFLIVAPLSTLPNWVHEFQTFAPKLPVVLYHGTEEKRKSLVPCLKRESELLGKKVLPVVVTSYEVPIKDYRVLSKTCWRCIVVDEGHRIKNYKTALARTLSSMPSINRLLLTGTPLQNDLTELWSLLHFILPEVFDDLVVFETLFTAEELAQNQTTDVCLEKEAKGDILSLLHEVLTPFLLRRLKSDVDMNIPPKKEILVHCPMTRVQLDLYKSVLDETILLFNRDAQRRVSPLEVHIKKKKRYSKLRDPSECESVFEPEVVDESEVRVFGTSGFQYKLKIKMTVPMIELIKILNHPYLIHPKVYPGSCYLQVDEEIVECSGKMTMLDGLLERLKARGHRVLVFSTYTQMLDLIEDFANMRGYQWRRLDGTTNIDDRRLFMREFNTNPNIFMFLLSTRAGGLGINLTGADTVIIFNSDWNPQVDLQAQDRCHRIGQTKPVVVYRFITPGTYDGRIIARAESKRKLEKMILQKGKFKHGSAGKEDIVLTLQELKALLNERQHNLEIQPNGTTLTDEQWEVLLDRSDLVEKCK